MSSLAVADPIARVAALKNCPVCSARGTSVPVSPEEVACGRCGFVVHRPPHTSWPMAVKWFALWEYARANRFQLRPEQQAWELLVCDIVNGSRAGFALPNPFGLATNAPIERCLQLVIPIALAWREAGAPFAREQFRLPQSA